MPESVVKSEKSTTPALVRFLNKSNRTIDIVWIDFEGEFIPYKTLHHNQFVDVNTYKDHPWIFIDSKTRDLMRVKNKNIFYPNPAHCPRTGIVGRNLIFIHLPLYSLRKNSLLTVRNLVRNSVNIDVLELPVELKNDLQKSFDKQNGNRYILRVPDS